MLIWWHFRRASQVILQMRYFINQQEIISRYLFVQSQKWKKQNKMWNLFQVNKKDTRTISLTSFWCLWTCFTHCSDVFIVDFEHSHKKRKDNLEPRAVLIKISMLCWNLPSGPKHRESLSKKSMAFSEGKKLFLGDFRANLGEINTDMVQFTKK